MAGFTEEEYMQSQDTSPVDPPKGSTEWAEQNSGDKAPTTTVAPTTAPKSDEAGVEDPTTTTVSPEEQQRKDAVMGYDRQIAAINKAMESLQPEETPEQRKKRERREKASRIIGAVSDGLRAMSNLYLTSQYAPNMYNHEKGSQLNATNAWIDKLKADRDADRDKRLHFALNLGNAENGRAATLRELEAQQERMKMAREKAAREAEAHDWAAALQPDKQREQKGKADRAAQLAVVAEEEAKNAPAMQQAELDAMKARGEASRASAAASRASAANSRASAAAHNRSNPLEYSAWDERGREHKFRTKDAADRYARQHGTYQEEDVVSTIDTETTDARGKKSSRTAKTIKQGGHAGKPSPTGGRKSPTA